MSDRLFRSLRGGRLVLAGFLALLLLLLIGRWGVALYVDYLWFSGQSHTEVYLRQLLWEWGARAIVGTLTALLVWINLRVVARTFSGLQLKRRFGRSAFVLCALRPGRRARAHAFGSRPTAPSGTPSGWSSRTSRAMQVLTC